MRDSNYKAGNGRYVHEGFIRQVALNWENYNLIETGTNRLGRTTFPKVMMD